MKVKKVFIDGQYGTVGLQIHDRLKSRKDLEIVKIEEALKKDISEKKRVLNSVDIVFLCLPDEASKESVSLITNENVVVIDGSTAHRTDDNWTFGLPELYQGHRDKIQQSKRISVPGCYSTGFNLLLHPLIREGVLDNSYPVSTYAITGYSGGGNQMISDFQANSDDISYTARPKNLNLKHKHLPEMKKYSMLKHSPIFTPIVGNFYNGMLVFIPIHKSYLKKEKLNLLEFYSIYYRDETFIHVLEQDLIDKIDSNFISPIDCNGTNNLDIMVFESDEQLLLVSRLDNLGKGASGAAVQCLNIILGVDEDTAL